MLLSLEILTSIIRTGLPILVELSNDLTQMVNFPTRIPDCASLSPALLDFFLSFDASFCFTLAFPPLGNSDHVVTSISIDFPSNSQQDAPFHRIAYDYSRVEWDGLHDQLRDVPWDDIFKLGASAAAVEFCESVQVGIDVYIPLRICQAKPHPSPWFSAICAAAIVHGNNFFRLYQSDKSSDSKVRFRQAINLCKRVQPNLHMLINKRVHHFPETWFLGLLANC